MYPCGEGRRRGRALKTVAGSDGGRWRETAVVLVVAFGGLSGAAGAAVVVEIKKKKSKSLACRRTPIQGVGHWRALVWCACPPLDPE